MKVTFFGHGKHYYDEMTRAKLRDIIENLISEGADEFYLGGYGGFDMAAAHTLKQLKLKYPHIKSIFVIPYLDNIKNKELYDSFLYPSLENVPKRFAIVKRNEWMAKNADWPM